MKIVINGCFGGFSLSPAAVKRLAELNGRECYFFKHNYKTNEYEPAGSDPGNELSFTAFDIPNPNEIIGESFLDSDGSYKTHNKLYKKHNLTSRPDDRADPKLIQVVEELGGDHRTGASGMCAKLEIVEIPDGINWEIEEYDGNEHIAETHRTWR